MVDVASKPRLATFGGSFFGMALYTAFEPAAFAPDAMKISDVIATTADRHVMRFKIDPLPRG